MYLVDPRIITDPHVFFFYASVPKVPEALCFRVVRPSGFFRLRDNSSIT